MFQMNLHGKMKIISTFVHLFSRSHLASITGSNCDNKDAIPSSFPGFLLEEVKIYKDASQLHEFPNSVDNNELIASRATVTYKNSKPGVFFSNIFLKFRRN